MTMSEVLNFDIFTGYIKTFCNETKSQGQSVRQSDVERCVRERTFPLSSSIKQNMMNSSLWSSKMATV